jgi:hypothetical protein
VRSLNRREFLARGLVAAAGAGIVGRGLGMEAAGPRPCPAAAWEKHGVVLGAEPGNPLQNFTCPAEPIGDDCWRLWYTTTGANPTRNIGFAEGRPGEPMKRCLAALSAGEPADAPFSLGNLPESWRPIQVVHLRLRNGRHRIYFWAHGPKIVRYLAAESEDGRRYRVVDPLRACLYHPSDRAVDGMTAAQAGLKRLANKKASPVEGEPLAPARLVSNDATNVYQLDDGSFEMYSVGLVEVSKSDRGYVAHDNAAGWIRVIDRYASADGLHWTQRRRVLVPDPADPADMQFYYLAVTHTPRGRLGMLGHYRVEAQTMDLEFCFSSDGIAWQRPSRRPWIARGEPPAPDCYGIYAPHALVERGGRWHLFYTSTNQSHNHKHAHGKPAQQVMYATCASPWSAG